MAGPSDRSDVVGTLPQTERRDFSAVGYDEAMRRARAIVPALRERAQKCEDARMLIRENEQLLHETGLFRFHQPKAFGGMELAFVAIFDIPAELARGCPSTAWNVGNLGCHHWILGYYAPVMWLKQKVDARRAAIQKGLPDAMDLLVIAVDAGLGFDAALARVTDKYKNALSDMFAKVLREVSLGRARLEAMDEMGRSSGVDDLHNFIQAIIQSEQFGTGIGKILRIQADEMRRKRRQRAQEKAAQATLKMMLPMVGCIFPTLWIVLLGPAVLILMKPR